MRKSILLTQILLLNAISLFAQKAELAVGITYKPEISFQRTDGNTYFDKYWTVDIHKSLGADIEINYRSIGFGIGVFTTRLGFNKNNPDTADGLFVRPGRGRTFIIDNIKYRAGFIEVPLTLYYRITHKRLNFKMGISYSFYWEHNSFIKDISYYQYNVHKEQEVIDACSYFIHNISDKFNAICPYFELEQRIGNAFSCSFKAGLKIYTERYHKIFIANPFSISGGLSVNYYLIK